LCSRYLFSWVGQRIVVALEQSGGERSERRLRRRKRGERVAAVDRCQGASSPKADVGHRNRMYFRKKKPPTFIGGSVFALPGFPGRPGIVLALRNMPAACFSKKKLHTDVWSFLVFALPIFPGRPTYCRGVGTVRWTVSATLLQT